jgi:hypothetical protein
VPTLAHTRRARQTTSPRRLTRVRLRSPHDAPAEEVAKIVSRLESNGLAVWLDGGWGVDAPAGNRGVVLGDLVSLNGGAV